MRWRPRRRAAVATRLVARARTRCPSMSSSTRRCQRRRGPWPSAAAGVALAPLVQAPARARCGRRAASRGASLGRHGHDVRGRGGAAVGRGVLGVHAVDVRAGRPRGVHASSWTRCRSPRRRGRPRSSVRRVVPRRSRSAARRRRPEVCAVAADGAAGRLRRRRSAASSPTRAWPPPAVTAIRPSLNVSPAAAARRRWPPGCVSSSLERALVGVVVDADGHPEHGIAQREVVEHASRSRISR